MRNLTSYRTLTHSGQVTLRYTIKDYQDGRPPSWFTSRAQRAFEDLPRWKNLRILDQSGDVLAYRAFILQSEGLETVQNAILHHHGRPNRW